jgi:uncharacterized protein (DUF924 family)
MRGSVAATGKQRLKVEAQVQPMLADTAAADAVLRFWFDELVPEDWWSAKPELDRTITERFGALHASIARGEGFGWRGTPAGRLAEIIVLDQFSRQIYRGTPRAFAQDGMALALAQEAVAAGHDRALPETQRPFMYMPLMHAESVRVVEAALPLFNISEGFAKAAADHLEVLRRFGRYPKRNAILGRPSTPEELAYLAEVGDRMF